MIKHPVPLSLHSPPPTATNIALGNSDQVLCVPPCIPLRPALCVAVFFRERPQASILFSMASKGVDPGEVKLGPGWMSLGRKTRNGVPPAASPSSSTSALPRLRYTKAELLEVYEPGAPPGLPANMSAHPGITSVDALVPVNIAPDEDLHDILHSNAQSPPGRVKPRGLHLDRSLQFTRVTDLLLPLRLPPTVALAMVMMV